MKFKLPCQIGEQDIVGIISREIKKQKIRVLRASQKDLKEIANVSEQIRKHGLPNYLVCKKLPQGLGHGIFLHPEAKPIPKGHVIAPYAGEVSLDPQKSQDDSAYVFEMIADIHLSKEEQLLLGQASFLSPAPSLFDKSRCAQKREFHSLH